MPLSCTDWRLPTRAELQTIRTEIALDQFSDPDYPQTGDFVNWSEYWTGENYLDYEQWWWAVNLSTGAENYRGEYNVQIYARGVRSDTMEAGEYDIGEEGPGNGVVFHVDGTDLKEVTNIEMQKTNGDWQLYHPEAADLVENYVTYKYPPPPESLMVVDSEVPGAIKLEWDTVEGAVSYKVLYTSGLNEDPESAVQTGGSIFTNQHTVTDLEVGETYNFWTKATNQRGDSGFSEMASGTPAMGEGDLIKSKYDAAFLRIGNTITLRKYPINETWLGTFPHRDDAANDYPLAEMVTEDVKGIVTVTGADVGATRSTWTSGTGQSYPTSVKDGSQSRDLYLPVNSTTNDFLTMLLVGSSTSNRSFNYGRDVIIFMHNSKWFWAGTVEKYTINEVDVFYKLSGQVVDEINWPFEYCFDIRGNVRPVEKIVADLDTDYLTIDLDS